MSAFEVGAFLSELVAMFRLRAENKGLLFEIVAEDGCATCVRADEGKLRQILINLLGNAVKFTKRGAVKARVSIKAREDGRFWLSALVSDTGIGIALEDQRRLFEPFTQLHHGKNSQPGTGLGLAISSEFARLMGGRLTLSSELGRGTVFHLEVPVEPGDCMANTESAHARHVRHLAPGKGVPRILLADNEPTSRGWLNQLLTSVGFQVREAVDGAAAVQIWQAWRPRLILMDLDMPGVNGLEAIRSIRAQPAERETVIIVLTASAVDDERQMALRCGANDYLPKPCLERDLLEKLRKHLGVTYVYADEGALRRPGASGCDTATLPTEALANMPARLRDELHDAILVGDKTRIDKLIRAVHEHDAPLARSLQDLANRYDYDTLNHLLARRDAGPDLSLRPSEGALR
jgi:CheY-like chemotaxis protein